MWSPLEFIWHFQNSLWFLVFISFYSFFSWLQLTFTIISYAFQMCVAQWLDIYITYKTSIPPQYFQSPPGPTVSYYSVSDYVPRTGFYILWLFCACESVLLIPSPFSSTPSTPPPLVTLSLFALAMSLFLCFACYSFFCFEDFVYIFLERGERREKERKGNIHVWLPLPHPWLGTRPATQARALTGTRTGDPLLRRSALNPLSHTSRGCYSILYIAFLNFSWCIFSNHLLSVIEYFRSL